MSKTSVDIEIPLLGKLNTAESETKQQQQAINDYPKKDPNSHFINFFNPSSPPSKYIQKVPFFKWFTFLQVLPQIKTINRSNQKLTFQDVPSPETTYNVERKIIDLDYYWSQRCKSGDPSFYKALVQAFKKEIIIAMALSFLDCTARLCYSVFLGKIVNGITNKGQDAATNEEQILFSSFVLCALIIIAYMSVNWAFYYSFTSAAKARLSITGLLYKKLNSISLTSLHDFKIGKVINLIANDLNDIDFGIIFVPTMILCPYIIILALAIMWSHFGFYSIFGLIPLIFVLLGQIYVSNKTVEPRKENKQYTDDRIKFTNEIIENIRLIKMYAWEKPFRKNIEALREKEYNTFIKIVKLDALGRNFSIIASYLSILLICTAYTSSGGILSPDKVYACMIILTFLSVSGLMFFHLGRMFTVNFSLILKRVEQVMSIENVLTASETLKNKKSVNYRREGHEKKGKVVFDKFTGYWSKNTQKPCLSDINLVLQPGTLTTIIGKIGSGKTTLLLALLRELPVTEGILSTNGKIAYVEQEPIIFSGTLRENIVFGKEYKDNLYRKVLVICNLDVDLQALGNGDLTIIGEQGVNLSGGQKARLSLARALYSESDIYLLDDPFSAIDSKVARDMFDNGLRGDLLKDKTLILVTHHIHFARESDYVVVMDEGRILAQRTFREVEDKDVDLLNIFNIAESRKSSVNSSLDQTMEEEPEEKPNLNQVIKKEKEEETEEDTISVSWSIYKQYMTVIGTYRDLIKVILLFGVYQCLIIYYTRFIGLWALEHNNYYYNKYKTINQSEFNHSYYIKTAWILLIVIYIVSYLKRITMSTFLLSTNTVLHQRMINSLTRAKVIFFDINPIGRILNRFANDIGILDKPNLIRAFDLIDGVLNSGSLLLTVCIVNPPLFIPAIIIFFLLTKVRRFFTKTAILTKKFELIARSPIFSTVSSTLTGLTIIRVYNSGGRFIRDFLDLIYNNSKAYLFMVKAFRLFMISLDACVRAMMIIGILVFTWLIFYVHFESALLGLSLLFLLQVGDETSYVIMQTLNVDISMQSAQRMIEYCHLESEAPEHVPTNDALVQKQFSGHWPARGDIIFNEVYLRYRSGLSPALNGLSFVIKGGTKGSRCRKNRSRKIFDYSSLV